MEKWAELWKIADCFLEYLGSLSQKNSIKKFILITENAVVDKVPPPLKAVLGVGLEPGVYYFPQGPELRKYA